MRLDLRLHQPGSAAPLNTSLSSRPAPGQPLDPAQMRFPRAAFPADAPVGQRIERRPVQPASPAVDLEIDPRVDSASAETVPDQSP
ncbi:MAG: hypothetical protein AAGG38_10045 [Planctomycetota bacterium]